ncbi:hypothetical protein MOX02_60240 [Methylobacterium oxalidis]|uniref:Transposase n=1 Tax=Methylobacterium oxalidis TaxID=944322 RepID=A0A512JDG9_9HYPH|nr:hypothetical protein MOX02_60240 [Methylobacterium oxalidis]GJE31140.1 hypothetical protein LDDCCGHA_1316 [Methylobacterium oxalidis]GLS66114.1 hypothetical protein GCM10007888_44960 [Methylobacterium oxalidis]
MKQTSGLARKPAEAVIKDIRRATRRQFSAEEKIRILLDGLRGEDSIAELWGREGIASSMYYGWSKEFLEAGKKRLTGDTARAATADEVRDLRREAGALKEVVADLLLDVVSDGISGRDDRLPVRDRGRLLRRAADISLGGGRARRRHVARAPSDRPQAGGTLQNGRPARRARDLSCEHEGRDRCHAPFSGKGASADRTAPDRVAVLASVDPRLVLMRLPRARAVSA